MVLTQSNKGIPAWITVDAEKNDNDSESSDVLFMRPPPSTSYSSSAAAAPVLADRNEIIEEILDGRPCPESIREPPLVVERRQRSRKKKNTAPLLISLSSTSMEENENTLSEIGDILNDLGRDPRMELGLPEELTFGVLAVEEASLPTVNGLYRCTGMVDHVGRYDKPGKYKSQNVVFSVFRCVHSDKSSRWYLSICSKQHAPGTRYDTDLYAAMATGEKNELPPSMGWRVVVGSGVQGTPPMTLWIPHESRIQPCVECGTRQVSHALIPCGHACLCDECADLVVQNKCACPVGHCPIQSAIRLYSSNLTSNRAMQRLDGPQVLPATTDGMGRMVL